MKSIISVGRIEVESQDPTFDYGTVHVAHATITNNTPKTYACTGELYLGAGKVATSGGVSFSLPANGAITVNFTITMPSVEGIWDPLLDVIVDGVIFGYIGTEKVKVVIAPDIDIGPIIWD